MPQRKGAKRHKCRECGVGVVTPGLCGFCLERQGVTVVQPEPEIRNDRRRHRQRVAIAQADPKQYRRESSGRVCVSFNKKTTFAI